MDLSLLLPHEMIGCMVCHITLNTTLWAFVPILLSVFSKFSFSLSLTKGIYRRIGFEALKRLFRIMQGKPNWSYISLMTNVFQLLPNFGFELSAINWSYFMQYGQLM